VASGNTDAASVLLLGEKLSGHTYKVEPGNRWSSLPVATSQRRTVWSELPEARSLPSGERTSETTGPQCLSRHRCSLPVKVSHVRMVPSEPAENSVLPSADNATEETMPWCPSRGPMILLAGRSQIRMRPSKLAEARVLPSGAKARVLGVY